MGREVAVTPLCLTSLDRGTVDCVNSESDESIILNRFFIKITEPPIYISIVATPFAICERDGKFFCRFTSAHWSFNLRFIRHGDNSCCCVAYNYNVSSSTWAASVPVSPVRTTMLRISCSERGVLLNWWCNTLSPPHDFAVHSDVTSYAWSPFLFLPMTSVEAWCGRCRTTSFALRSVSLVTVTA